MKRGREFVRAALLTIRLLKTKDTFWSSDGLQHIVRVIVAQNTSVGLQNNPNRVLSLKTPLFANKKKCEI